MLIKNALIIGEKESFEGDIRIEGERIHEIGPALHAKEGEKLIHAEGCLAVPGGVDVHTHFDMPCGEIRTSDDFYTGTRAAIAGGTTTIMDFSEPAKGASLQSGLDCWHEKAGGRSFCDYGFHMTLSRCDEQIEQEIVSMIAQGVTTFKAYTAYKGDLGVDDRELYRLLKLMKKYGTLLMVHCENGDILEERRKELGKEAPEKIINHALSRPNEVEHEAVSRVIDMASLVGAPVYIVHTSTRQALDEIRRAKQRGMSVFCETCPQYLLLTEKRYSLPGFEGAKYVCSPPLRTEEDRRRLWQGIREDVVDTISTDHCSFLFYGQKSQGREDFRKIPNGLPGVEHRLELLYSCGAASGLDYTKIARLTAGSPARIMGLYPKKGVIAPGSDADIVLLTRDCPKMITAASQMQAVDYTPYEGMEVSHCVRDVFLRGHKAVRAGKVLTKVPKGRYLPHRV